MAPAKAKPVRRVFSSSSHKHVDPVVLEEIRRKYAQEPIVDGAALSDVLAFFHSSDFKHGFALTLIFFGSLIFSLLLLPLLLGGADASLAGSVGLRSIVPATSLVIALIVLLIAFQAQFGRASRTEKQGIIDLQKNRERL